MQSKRWYVTRILLALILILLVWLVARLPDSGQPPMLDFVQYWAAGRLNLRGQNPYSPSELLALEREAEPKTDDAVMMWNPPWVLAIMAPIALLPYPVARAVWLLVCLGIVLVGPWWAWAVYSHAPEWRPAVSLLSGLFGPVLLGLYLGQISPLLLLGLCGFLYFGYRRQWWQAGLLATLATVKPQVLLLFWVALVFWSIHERRWALLAGLGAALTALVGLALLSNHAVLAQYLRTVIHSPPMHWGTHTTATALRLVLGAGQFWLLWVPVAVGIAWFLCYWRRRGRDWTWDRDLPILVLASIAASPYAWAWDFQIALLAIIQIMAQLTQAESRRLVLFGSSYVALSGALAVAFFRFANDVRFYVWMPLALLLAYLVARYWVAAERSPRDAKAVS